MINKSFLYSLGAIALIVVFVGIFAMSGKLSTKMNGNLAGYAVATGASGGTSGTGSGTPGTSTIREINANECRVDGTCEMNDFSATYGRLKGMVVQPSGSLMVPSSNGLHVAAEGDTMVDISSMDGSGGAGIQLIKRQGQERVANWKVKATSDGSFKIRNENSGTDIFTITSQDQVDIDTTNRLNIASRIGASESYIMLYELGMEIATSGGTGQGSSGINMENNGRLGLYGSESAVLGSGGSGESRIDMINTGESVLYGSESITMKTGLDGEVAFSIDTQSDVRFNQLGGNGSAYACLDSAGKLYRSMTPCVS